MYIDAEKLKAEIEKQIKSTESCPFIEAEFGAEMRREGKIQAYNEILSLIDSLQQEQPEKILTFGGFVDKVRAWFAHLRLDKFRKTFNGEIFPATQLVQEYDLFVQELSKTYSDKQEQPEVDLEKEMDEYFKGWTETDEGIACHYQYVDLNTCRGIARHFWNKGYNARKEE